MRTLKARNAQDTERPEAEGQLSPEHGRLGPQELTEAGDRAAVRDGEHSPTF